jgi:hypothetical protein
LACYSWTLMDWESGMSLGAVGGGKYLDLDVAAAGARRSSGRTPGSPHVAG